MSEPRSDRARMVGINHVALEVGDAEEALAFYRDLFDVEVRGRTDTGVFLDMGDQFLALMEDDDKAEDGDRRNADDHRHLGLVVDDPDALEDRLEAAGVERLATSGLDFRDPWGNRIQVVAYGAIQFTKADHVLEGMGVGDVEKSQSALAELAKKGMAPDTADRSP